MRRSLVAAGLAAYALAVAAPSAGAAWKPFASGGMNISDQVSLARTSDGVLHVGWFQAGYNVFQTPVSAAGGVGAAVPIVNGWASAGNPVLVAQGVALTAFWPGSPTLVTGDPQAGIDMATSANSLDLGSRSRGDQLRRLCQLARRGGRRRHVPAGVPHRQRDRRPRRARPSGARRRRLRRWDQSGAGGLGRGRGDGRLVHDRRRVRPICDRGDRSARRSALEHARNRVLRRRRAHATGRARSTAASSLRPPAPRDARCSCGRSAPRSAVTLAGGTSFKQQVALAAAPDGRLWAGWQDSDTAKAVFRRSNKTGTKWGAAVPVTLPPGRIFQLNLDARLDRVDAVIRTESEAGVVGLATDQIRPGLTLVATGGTRQSFRVLDAGDPIAGARIKVAGHSLTTDANGRATADLKPGRHTATASKRGYVNATAQVRAR